MNVFSINATLIESLEIYAVMSNHSVSHVTEVALCAFLGLPKPISHRGANKAILAKWRPRIDQAWLAQPKKHYSKPKTPEPPPPTNFIRAAKLTATQQQLNDLENLKR